MTAKEYLSQIEKLDRLIENKTADIKKWKAVANYSDLEEEIEELRQKRAKIIKTLERLDPVEYNVLYTIYVQGYTVSRAARRIYKSYRHTLRIRDRAFLNIQKLIDGE